MKSIINCCYMSCHMLCPVHEQVVWNIWQVATQRWCCRICSSTLDTIIIVFNKCTFRMFLDFCFESLEAKREKIDLRGMHEKEVFEFESRPFLPLLLLCFKARWKELKTSFFEINADSTINYSVEKWFAWNGVRLYKETRQTLFVHPPKIKTILPAPRLRPECL